jgi:hypothetical protein
MTSQYRHRRTSNPATPAPTLEPGEIAVNTANRQISLGDAAAGTLGTPKPLLAIRIFDIAAIYAIGDMVTNADKIWRAIVANGPGAFNAAQWELAASQVTISSNPPSNAVAGSMWWDSDNGMLYVRYNDGDSSQWVQATAMPVVDTSAFVAKAGDTMTGELILSYATSPTISLRKQVAGTNPQIRGYNASNLPRWTVNFCDAAAEAGSNQGSNFQIGRFDDAGGFIDGPLYISRSTGSVSVLTDPTIPLGVATKQYVDARAGDAMAYSGMQINGNFDVSQEFGTTNRTGVGYFCDGWTVNYAGGMVITSGVGATGDPRKQYQAYAFATTALPSLGTNGYTAIAHYIEGYRAARLAWGTAAAIPVTVCFWSNHSRAGLYTGAIRNAAADRSCVFSYTQAAASVPQWNTVTIPGCTDGVWNYANGIGLALFFTQAAGTAFNAPLANTWYNASYFSLAGQVNNVQAVNDTCRLMSVIVLPGTQAPTAAQSPLLMRPYEQELLTCQRYYQKSYSAGVNVGADASAGGLEARYIASPAPHGQVYASVSLPIKMRATPTVTIYGYHGGATKISDGAGNDLAANSGLISNPGDARFHVGNNSGISLTLPGNFIQFHWTADARL